MINGYICLIIASYQRTTRSTLTLAVKGKLFVNISSRALQKFLKYNKHSSLHLVPSYHCVRKGTEEISVSVSYHDNMD